MDSNMFAGLGKMLLVLIILAVPGAIAIVWGVVWLVMWICNHVTIT